MTAAEEIDLVPGVRDRLQARLAAMGVPQHRVVAEVADITCRSRQSVRRWFATRAPGLPDLESFARLCVGLGCSADEVLGLSYGADGAPLLDNQLIAMANCVHAMTRALSRGGVLGVAMQVPGDEMAPHLCEGDIVFVDTAHDQVAGNGIYMLLCQDRPLIRRIEQGVGQALVLRCDNKSYGDHTFRSRASAARHGVQIVGKVHGAICARRF
jgi:hypothetical protein